MKVLYVHTETAGKWHFDIPTLDARQPLMVILGARLISTDDDIRLIDDMVAIVRQPPKLVIEPLAARCHGVTDEIASEQGLVLCTVVDKFSRLVAQADVMAMHNVRFNSMVIRRSAWAAKTVITPHFIDRPHFIDTQQLAYLAMNDVYGPAQRQFPPLGECYQHFVGEPMREHDDPLRRMEGILHAIQTVHEACVARAVSA